MTDTQDIPLTSEIIGTGALRVTFATNVTFNGALSDPNVTVLKKDEREQKVDALNRRISRDVLKDITSKLKAHLESTLSPTEILKRFGPKPDQIKLYVTAPTAKKPSSTAYTLPLPGMFAHATECCDIGELGAAVQQHFERHMLDGINDAYARPEQSHE